MSDTGRREFTACSRPKSSWGGPPRRSVSTCQIDCSRSQTRGLNELPRFHYACWRRGGVAGRGARATMARRSTGSDMKGVADWLASIGLSEYAQRFADNAIDLSVICDLTEQDLKELGVLLGHRRKLLRAIAE